MPHDYSPRCRQFLDDLDALCRRHNLRLETQGYDEILIYHGTAEDGAGIERSDFVEVLPPAAPQDR